MRAGAEAPREDALCLWVVLVAPRVKGRTGGSTTCRGSQYLGHRRE